jgi:hypothetical protein
MPKHPWTPTNSPRPYGCSRVPISGFGPIPIRLNAIVDLNHAAIRRSFRSELSLCCDV